MNKLPEIMPNKALKKMPSFKTYIAANQRRKRNRKLGMVGGLLAIIALFFVQCDEEPLVEGVESTGQKLAAVSFKPIPEEPNTAQYRRPSIGKVEPEFTKISPELTKKSQELILTLKRCISDQTQAKLDWSFLYNAHAQQVSEHEVEVTHGKLAEKEKACIVQRLNTLQSLLVEPLVNAKTSSPTLKLHMVIDLL